MPRLAVRLGLFATLALLLPACGGSGGGIVYLSGVALLTLDLRGGTPSAPTSTGGHSRGGSGGDLLVFSTGPLHAGIDAAPEAPPLPPVPTSGILFTDFGGANFSAPGTILLNGNVTTDTLAGVRVLTSTGGDIVINGTLTAGDPGATMPLDLTLTAPNGTIYVLGTINLANTDGTPSGDRGGSLVLDAPRIIFAGAIHARGEDHPNGQGGNGGTVTFRSTSSIVGTEFLFLGGTIDTTGGSSNAPVDNLAGGAGGAVNVTGLGSVGIYGTSITTSGGTSTSVLLNPLGGAGGTISVEGPGGVDLAASVITRGGEGRGTGGASIGAIGGAGGNLRLNAVFAGKSGPVRIFGTVDLRGGGTAAAGTSAVLRSDGGAGGTLQVGSSILNAPELVEMGLGDWTMAGGDAPSTGGPGGDASIVTGLGSILLYCSITTSPGTGAHGTQLGGNLSLLTRQGDILVYAPLRTAGTDNDGLDSSLASDGGLITLSAGGAPTDRGSIVIAASLDSHGGSRLGTMTVNGGSGGSMLFTADNGTGSVTLLPSAGLNANGGRCGGDGLGGAGGTVTFRTRDRKIDVLGNITAIGGGGGAAGFGGPGGRFVARSDNDNTDVAGSITIGAGVTIDVSGGSAGVGGDARTGGDGTAAVVIASDGDAAGSGDDVGEGTIVNNGVIRALGGAGSVGSGGDGGTALLSGRGLTVGSSPVSGVILLTGGAGLPPGLTGAISLD